jgi:hypothetical protein
LSYDIKNYIYWLVKTSQMKAMWLNAMLHYLIIVGAKKHKMENKHSSLNHATYVENGPIPQVGGW